MKLDTNAQRDMPWSWRHGAMLMAGLGLGMLVQHTFTTNELRCLFKTLYQTPTLLLRLHVPPHADVDALLRYWGAGGRARIIKPLLEGLAKAHGERSINVSLLSGLHQEWCGWYAALGVDEDP